MPAAPSDAEIEIASERIEKGAGIILDA